MTPQDIVRIVDSFFKAILRILIALKLVEPETEEETTTEAQA